ncbi:hypothetical protein NP493_1417g00036 [Ridgeia piscesae]|uniref:THD domain-containing protein n=1 Tax=Ridgeia piscesae TaxID=27915 RepID=A0AAD9NDL3_RIDPI|nr:hypothetical protein NP493_1417g00036 [Ridgeia piscesae]
MFSSMFRYNNDTGETLVKEPGLYYIYSQITMSTNALRSGYSIYIDGKAHFTCVCHRSVNSSNEMLQNTCTSSGLVVLSRRQKISLGVESEDLHALMKPRLSFWGMIKLAGFRYVIE